MRGLLKQAAETWSRCYPEEPAAQTMDHLQAGALVCHPSPQAQIQRFVANLGKVVHLFVVEESV
jgi:hypothetical protein